MPALPAQDVVLDGEAVGHWSDRFALKVPSAQTQRA